MKQIELVEEKGLDHMAEVLSRKLSLHNLELKENGNDTYSVNLVQPMSGTILEGIGLLVKTGAAWHYIPNPDYQIEYDFKWEKGPVSEIAA